MYLRSSRIILILPLLLLDCAQKQKMAIDKSTGEHTVKQVLPGQGPVEAPGHGKELWFAIAPLTGVSIPANGVAQAHYLEDGASIVTVQLNIERAEEGSFLEAWLVGADPTKRISLGHLRTPFGDVRHQLKYIGKDDLRSYTTVLVTLEEDDGNPSASESVAEGVLKDIKR